MGHGLAPLPPLGGSSGRYCPKPARPHGWSSEPLTDPISEISQRDSRTSYSRTWAWVAAPLAAAGSTAVESAAAARFAAIASAPT
jgi:hypothetical protein